MKTKMLLTAALIGAASLSAHAGVRFGFSFGIPLPVVVTAPVVVAPAPVVVAPAPVVAPEVVAPCVSPDYVWAPGYWAVVGGGRHWVGGGWHYRGGYGYDHAHGWHR